MIYNVIVATIFFIKTSFCIATPLDNILIDFDESMNISSSAYIHKYNNSGINYRIIRELKELYNTNHFSKIKRSGKVKVPKIIHQIWVGPKPVPNLLKTLQASWKFFHPNWQCILWTNDNVEPLLKNLSADHQEMYHSAIDPREKADILRYYLLYWYGGVYVDADFKCLKSLEELNFYYDFYVGISANNVTEIVNNALIGSKAKHPILKNLISNLKKITTPDWKEQSGVFFFSNEIIKTITSSAGTNIALPTSILYSVPYKYNKKQSANQFIRPESIAIHYWANSSNPNWQENN